MAARAKARASEAVASEAAGATIKRAKAAEKRYIRVGIDSLIKRIKEEEEDFRLYNFLTL